MRTIIIGDIHGCFKELVLLLEKVQFDQRRDLLISLGDMIDRGPRSFQVFEYLRSLKSRMGEACILIRGNHEQMMIDYGAGCDCALEMWEADGGSDTRKDFLAHHASIEEAARWLKENTILYYRTPWFQCVHAGVLKEHPCRNSEECLLWDRSALFLNRKADHRRPHSPFDCNPFYGKTGNLPPSPLRRRPVSPRDRYHLH